MNEYDSQKMFALLGKTHQRVEEASEASVVILNTCSVREKAEHKLYSLLGTLRELKEKNPHLVIGVSGCVAQQEGKDIVRSSDLVDFVVGTHNLSLVPSLVRAAQEGHKPQVAVDYRDEWEDLPEEFDAYAAAHDESLDNNAFGAYGSSVRALVAIQRGCDKKCAFCVVPTTRGPEVSRSPDEIERELRLKVRLGAKEVLLLGQTVNSYGKDLTPRYRFESLIERLASIDGLERIRFTSPHPADVRPGFLELYGSIPQLCPHIHLPLQSGNDRVLKLMNRNYKVGRYLDIVASLKNRCPNIAITSDMIVGFPTETDEEFEDTLRVMREVEYSSSFSFIYSKRPHTVAINAFNDEDHVALEIAKERLLRLQALQAELTERFNRKFIGKTVEMLVEGASRKGGFRGRIPENTSINVRDDGMRVGEIRNVLVESANVAGLSAKAID